MEPPPVPPFAPASALPTPLRDAINACRPPSGSKQCATGHPPRRAHRADARAAPASRALHASRV
eukprot:6657090-Prymnesium_polylepis.1